MDSMNGVREVGALRWVGRWRLGLDQVWVWVLGVGCCVAVHRYMGRAVADGARGPGMLRALAGVRGIHHLTDEELEHEAFDHLALLPVGSRSRVAGYREQVRQLFGSDGRPDGHVLVNVVQSPHFAPVSRGGADLFPTLLRKSYIADVGGKRRRLGAIVHPIEHLAAMGFPTFAEGTSVASTCPFPAMLVDAGDGFEALRELLGNGMHVVSIGSWLQVNLACWRLLL